MDRSALVLSSVPIEAKQKCSGWCRDRRVHFLRLGAGQSQSRAGLARQITSHASYVPPYVLFSEFHVGDDGGAVGRRLGNPVFDATGPASIGETSTYTLGMGFTRRLSLCTHSVRLSSGHRTIRNCRIRMNALWMARSHTRTRGPLLSMSNSPKQKAVANRCRPEPIRCTTSEQGAA